MMDLITNKSLSITLSLLLILNLFVMDSPVSDQRCKCTNNCDGQGFNAKAVSISHGCCSGTQRIPCNFHKDQTQNVPKSFTLFLRLESNKTADTIVGIISETKLHSPKSYCAQQISWVIDRSAPIYLQYIPLLC